MTGYIPIATDHEDSNLPKTGFFVMDDPQPRNGELMQLFSHSAKEVKNYVFVIFAKVIGDIMYLILKGKKTRFSLGFLFSNGKRTINRLKKKQFVFFSFSCVFPFFFPKKTENHQKNEKRYQHTQIQVHQGET